MLKLPNVTLVCVSSVKIDESINAIKNSMNGVEYGDAIFISHDKPLNLPTSVRFEPCKLLANINDYNYFILFDLVSYIKTDYIILIQYDGYVLRPNKWDNIFLNYDYIGAPWPKNSFYTTEGINIRVGNGGFTLRSKKLLNILNELKLPFTDNGTGYFNEDGIICNYHRKTLEDNGIKFATPEVAAMFSHELNCDEDVSEPFGFHKHKK